ncbi:MAG: NPCBM/NEW2 domain-containing protein [Kiritimatiellia bacterium]|jgi:hypothetical protein
MPGAEHSHITSKALGLLPDWAAASLGSDAAALVERCCLFPDRHMDVRGSGYAEAKAYAFEIDGVPFHYLPDSPAAPGYRDYKPNDAGTAILPPAAPPNLNWKHARAGFAHYLAAASEALRQGRTADACANLGWLLHVLQDATFGLHCFEGPAGGDCLVLNRFFPETAAPSELPTAIVPATLPFDADCAAGCAPTLLGTSVAEAVLHLYARYARTAHRARRLCHEAVVAVKHGVAAIDAVALAREMSGGAVAISADVLYTAACLAAGHDGREVQRLNHVCLSDLEPVERPCMSSHYGFVGMLRDQALDSSRRPGPLATRVDGRRKTFDKGVGLGAHYGLRLSYDIPPAVYDRFSCTLGLHSDCIGEGEIQASLICNGATVFFATLSDAEPSVSASAANPEGLLELRLANREGLAGKAHAVWGDPMLHKRRV